MNEASKLTRKESASSRWKSYHDRPSYVEHLGSHRQYWRDIILAVNDGLVSTFFLVSGVAGGGIDMHTILLTAISGGIAGAISMGAGEYIATKSQDDVMKGEITVEKSHIKRYQSFELMELHELLPIIGLDPEQDGDLFHRVVQHYRSNDDALLKVMIALEFGVIEEERRNPWKAAFFSFLLFLL